MDNCHAYRCRLEVLPLAQSWKRGCCVYRRKHQLEQYRFAFRTQGAAFGSSPSLHSFFTESL